MRLDFNYVVIDDDFVDEDDIDDVQELIDKINKKLGDKGFEPKVQTYASKSEFETYLTENRESTNRIDLYLSDNNLGDHQGLTDVEHANDGIQIYLDLKKAFICDFVLYTRSSTTEIINKMTAYLTEQQNPGLFSRFTFVPREDSDWHDEILVLLDHILTKREEMNNLRGLFAEKISKIDLHLKNILNRNKGEKFYETVNAIPSRYFNDTTKKAYLNNLRQMRNALLHQNEFYDKINKEYIIKYELENNKGKAEIRESKCSIYRKQMNDVFKDVMSWE